MLSRLMNFLRACWRPSSDRYVHAGSDAVGRQDGLLCYKDTRQHMNGEFSMVVVQANNMLEDQSQIESDLLSSLESGHYSTFGGIYDGHGGPKTSRYINDHLFQHLKMKNVIEKPHNDHLPLIEASYAIWTSFLTYIKSFALPFAIVECSWKLVKRLKISGKL